MPKFKSVKLFDGFSTCFRQWKAEDTHCKFLHGYAVSFEVTFEGELDHRNWVADFGMMKRSKHTIDGMNPGEWFKWLLDHTTIIAQDDPHLTMFQGLAELEIIQLRILPTVGCERFAEYLFDQINQFVQKETNNRVNVVQVQVFEHSKNSAIYSR